MQEVSYEEVKGMINTNIRNVVTYVREEAGYDYVDTLRPFISFVVKLHVLYSYSRPLNNMGFNCVSLLVCGFFQSYILQYNLICGWLNPERNRVYTED